MILFSSPVSFPPEGRKQIANIDLAVSVLAQ